MGYRNYNPGRTHRRHKPKRRAAYQDEERTGGLFGAAGSIFRTLGQGLAMLWRLLVRKRPTEQTDTPPYRPAPQQSNSTPPATGSVRAPSSFPQAPARLASAFIAATPPPDLPYRRASAILSKGERAFWVPLCQAVHGKYQVFSKVRLADVVCCPPHRKDEPRWFKLIGRFHVDFVICDPRTTAPLLVVELDDRRHREGPRKSRDDFKDQVLRAAGMPIYRVNAQGAYDPIELAERIDALIHSHPADNNRSR